MRRLSKIWSQILLQTFLRRRTFPRSLTLLALTAAPLASSFAQAVPTATKSADFSIFFGYATVQPDYGPYRNSGGVLGANFTRYFHFPVAPSVELRANFANGTTVNERSYLIGLRAQADLLARVHPYANFLAGPGNIHFNFPSDGYTGDNSVVYSYGGGADLDLLNNFAAKVDFQEQHWRLGVGTGNTFHPNLLLFGVTYRIPFQPHVHQGEISH